MNDENFMQCTAKLLKMSECIKEILESIENVNEEKLEDFKDCVQFIHQKVNDMN